MFISYKIVNILTQSSCLTSHLALIFADVAGHYAFV